MLKRLKGEFFANDIDRKILSEKLGKSQTYLTARLMGRKSFTVKEAYVICEMLELPYSSIMEFFPKDDLRNAK